MHALDAAAVPVPETLNAPRIGATRLAIGLAQGLVLYGLYRAAHDRAWPATEPLLFVPLLLVVLLVPLILISSLGHMAGRKAALWILVATVVVAGLGLHDSWRAAAVGVAVPTPSPDQLPPAGSMPSAPVGFLLVAGLFIAHTLVLAGTRDRRRLAAYASYFEIAWKLAVQLGFSALFVGVSWAALMLGAELFQLVKLDFLAEAIRKPWFAIPVTTFAFACALQLTDVRPAIVRGIRSLLLMLMSWILPVMTLLVGAFLLSLPFTGLAPLWATRHAGAVLLATDAAFVVLVNAAWQDGNAIATASRVIRASARVAALLLVPLTALAIHALSLRVQAYGWTDDRIHAAACLVVASCYALGYAWAAVRGGSLEKIAGVNVASAYVVLATLLLVLTPVADPARLSVNDQLARLAAGKVSVDQFDFAYLRFEGMRYGREALLRMTTAPSRRDAALVRERAAAARNLRSPWERRNMALPPSSLEQNVDVWPRGQRLPASFLHTNASAFTQPFNAPECLRDRGKRCDAFLLDVTGDGKPEVILLGKTATGGSAVMAETAPGQWRRIATVPFQLTRCESARSAMMAGQLTATAPAIFDLAIGGRRVRLDVEGPGCEPKK
jgi:hypothetical protein